ncbi:MAG: riboflavin synthase [Candidatus Moraniibacteriota bacterium]
MFTGIIKKVSTVEKVFQEKESLFVQIKKPQGWKVWLGQSIAINGVCSTVKKLGKSSFVVEYMPETIKKTTVGKYRKGTLVNLETSLKLNDLLDGHLVQGHVDTTGKILAVKKVQESIVLKIVIPLALMKFVADKGSVAIDGISLTVVSTGKNWLTVSLVSFTLENTNLGKIKVGDEVNIETDVLAKYLAKLMK